MTSSRSGGFDIAVTSEDYGGAEDRRWFAHRKGFDTARSVTLDVSTFLPAHVTGKGALPSGTVLARITATGKYGPYEEAAVDGRSVAAGFLLNTTKISAADGSNLATASDIGVAMVWEGIVKELFLPAFAGTILGELDAPARVDLKFVRFE
jgi:hypothetical protein